MKTDSNGNKYITITDLPKFKKSYDKTVREGKKIFSYEGSEILTTYAKYLIEYMELNKKK